MDADRARALAARLYHGQLDAGGAPLIEHVQRVAAAVPGDPRVVAWLHEVLEYTSVSEEALLAEGLSLDDLADRALNPSVRANGWSPPYELALEILRDAPPPDTRAPSPPPPPRPGRT